MSRARALDPMAVCLYWVEPVHSYNTALSTCIQAVPRRLSDG